MKKPILFANTLLALCLILGSCGSDNTSTSASSSSANTSSAAPAAASTASSEQSHPAEAQTAPIASAPKPVGDIPIKLPPQDTAKMNAALRQIEASKNNAASAVHPTTTEAVSPFVGKWSMENVTAGESFDVKIVQHNAELRGEYCAVIRKGARIDCIADEGEQAPSFKAPVPKGNSFETTFTTYRDNALGIVKISLEGGKLHWVITKAPDKECYAKRDAYLVKTKK